MPYTTSLFAFGSNGESQLGLGFATDKHPTPTLVSGAPSDIKEIRGGGNHTLILTSSGSVYGCGLNSSGQLTNHAPTKERNKQSHAVHTNGQLLKLFEFERIKFGSTSQDTEQAVSHCGGSWDASVYIFDRQSVSIEEKKDASVYATTLEDVSEISGGLGDSAEGQGLPLSRFKHSLSPAVVDFATGPHHYAAVCEDGSVKAWGRWKKGQLGNHQSVSSTTIPAPVHIKEIPFKAERVICGQHFTYVVGSKEVGEHLVLGDDKHGVRSKMPTHVKSWKDIGATWNAVFVLFQDGRLEAWGKELLWQLVPNELPKLKKIAAGSDHILALTEEGKVIAWGWATHGNCGNVEKREEEQKLKKGYLTNTWNQVDLGENVGEVVGIGAGCSTSFVWTRKWVKD